MSDLDLMLDIVQWMRNLRVISLAIIHMVLTHQAGF